MRRSQKLLAQHGQLHICVIHCSKLSYKTAYQLTNVSSPIPKTKERGPHLLRVYLTIIYPQHQKGQKRYREEFTCARAEA